MTFEEFAAREKRKVTRCFQRYSHEERMNMAASHMLGHRQREAVGEFFYTHPNLPHVAFPTRKAALRAAYCKTLEEQT